MSEAFERRREAIRGARQAHADCSYRKRLTGWQRGDYDSEEEALEGIETGPFEVTDEDVLHSFVQTLDTVRDVRAHADQLERDARSALGLDQEGQGA